MDRGDTATLAFKLAGVYVLVEAVSLIPTLAPSLKGVLDEPGDQRWHDLAMVGGPLAVACVLLLTLSIVLWRWAPRLADRVVGARQRTIAFTDDIGTGQTLAFAILGAVLLTQGILVLVEEALAALFQRHHLWIFLRSEASSLLRLFVELSLGYWLFFLPRSAVRWWLSWSDAAPPPAPLAGPTPAAALPTEDDDERPASAR